MEHGETVFLLRRIMQWPSTHFVDSVSLTTCTCADGKIDEAAMDEGAYTEGAYPGLVG